MRWLLLWAVAASVATVGIALTLANGSRAGFTMLALGVGGCLMAVGLGRLEQR